MGGIILVGHDPDLRRGFENAKGTSFIRAIDLSAPPLATPVNNVMTPATYLAGPPAWFNSTTIRNVYGLVSANDMRYYDTQYFYSYFGAAWAAMGFTGTNYDAEWDMNCTTGMNGLCHVTTIQGLNCLTQPNPHSDNLVTFAAESVSGGHHDPEFIWNQDSFEFLLLD